MSLYIIISSGMEAFDWSMENSRFPPFELNLILYLFLVPWKSPAFIHQSPKPETWELFVFPPFLSLLNPVYQYPLALPSRHGFPGSLDGKASAYNAGDPGSIPESGRPPGEGNGNPLLYSCLENPMDGGAWWATVHGVAKSWAQLSDLTFTF